MDYYNQNYEQPQYEFNDEYGLNPEFELENDASEFNYESEENYELLPEFELPDNESGDYEYESGSDYEGDMMQESSGDRDEMEAELEYVGTENEFNKWVSDIVVRDHRNRNLRPALSRPLVRTAVRQLSRIAARTLPYLGRRVGGWRGPVVRNVNIYNRRYPRPYWNRPGLGQRFGYPYPRPYPYGGGGGSTVYNNPYQQGQAQAQEPMQSSQEPVAQVPEQDGSFRRFVMDTIRNLSAQIAAGNESIQALRSSMVNSAVNNFPAAVQQKTEDTPPQPDTAQTAPPPAPNPTPEFEFEDYEYDQEFEGSYDHEVEGEITDSESSFREETEMELASELLNVQTDRELDHFLGGLLKKAVGAVSGLLNSGQGKMLKGILKSVAKKALPLAGRAIGGMFGGPAGAMIGGQLGDNAGNLFELDMEGMSNEDREFESARAMVRFAGNAARQVSDHLAENPNDAVRTGLREAAMRYAPGLLFRRQRRGRRYGEPDMSSFDSGLNGSQGTWYRRGNKIIIENI